MSDAIDLAIVTLVLAIVAFVSLWIVGLVQVVRWVT